MRKREDGRSEMEIWERKFCEFDMFLNEVCDHLCRWHHCAWLYDCFYESALCQITALRVKVVSLSVYRAMSQKLTSLFNLCQMRLK